MQEKLPADGEFHKSSSTRVATELGKQACNLIRRNGEAIARFSAATVLGSLAAVGATIAAPIETELANTKTTVTLNFKGNDGVDLSVGELYYGISDWPVGITAEPAIDQIVENAVVSGKTYADQLQAELQEQGDDILLELLARMGAGAAIGAALGMCLTEGIRGIKRHPKRLGTIPAATALAVGLHAGGYSVMQNEEWSISQPSETTGMLAKIQAAPQLFARLDDEQPLIAERVKAVNKLLSALKQEHAPKKNDTKTALSLLHVSDIHLRPDMYSYLESYIEENEIDIIINTGDEAQFSTTLEISDTHMDSLRRITEKGVIILFVTGNHDSPAIAAKISSIPGVYTLDKQYAELYGLTIAGFSDPITYTSGIDATSEASRDIQIKHAAETVSDIAAPSDLDIVMAHSKTAVEQYAEWAFDSRDTEAPLIVMNGHSHTQNSLGEIEQDNIVWLQEGTTGAGGITRFDYDQERVEFSQIDITENCEPVMVTRYSIKDPLTSRGEDGTEENESIVQRKRLATDSSDGKRKCGKSAISQITISSFEKVDSTRVASKRVYPDVDLTPDK